MGIYDAYMQTASLPSMGGGTATPASGFGGRLYEIMQRSPAVWTTLGASLLAGPPPSTEKQGPMASLAGGFRNFAANAPVAYAADAKTAMERQQADAAEAARKAQVNAIIGYPGLSPEDRAWYMANPDAFDPTKLGGGADPVVVGKDSRLVTPGGEVLLDAAPPPEGVSNETFDNQAKLRGEFTKATDDFTKVRNSYTRIQAAAKDTSGASDIAMIYSFMKMFDPTSVVREGEFATAANAGGIPDQIRSLYNRAINGERLTPEIRQQFLQQADNQFESAQTQLAAIESEYRRLAESYGYDPTQIVPDVRAGVSIGSLPTVNTPEEAAKLPPGTKFRTPDGKIRIVPEISNGG